MRRNWCTANIAVKLYDIKLNESNEPSIDQVTCWPLLIGWNMN